MPPSTFAMEREEVRGTAENADGAVAQAIDEGVVSGRLWLYSTYRCNLRCAYCLTGSGPDVAGRELSPERMLALAGQARSLGFTALGVTGGEPFLEPAMPELLGHLAATLPTVVLSNGTLFTGPRLDRLRDLAAVRLRVQVSLDRPDPIPNDAMRGPANFRKVVEAIPRLLSLGIPVRIATTLDRIDEEELGRLCALHRDLGVSDDDHVIRPIVRRGRATERGLGRTATPTELPPELTITADGAFWSPFGPTVTSGRLDTDLLITRETEPLDRSAERFVRLATSAGASVNGPGFR